MHRFLRWTVWGVALAFAGCSSNEGPTAPTTIGPPPTITQNFSGTLTVNGARTHPFTATTAGSIVVILTDVTPDGVIVGLTLGTWNGSHCTTVLSSDNADEGERIVLVASSEGNLCVRIHDTGSVTQPTTYNIQVEHS
jgi:hypothetical protein